MANKVSVDDVKTGWRGLSTKIPFVFPEPSKQQYCALHLGTINNAGYVYLNQHFAQDTYYGFERLAATLVSRFLPA